MTERDRTPLCVDLDGTLVRCDTLVESLRLLLRKNPFHLFRLPGWWAKGRARFKREVAERVTLDPVSLPYNPELLGYLHEQREQGRPILLVTASHRRVAQSIADHLAIFDDVIATDGQTNLKSHAKREALVERFGERGFDYAGNSTADLSVWPGAREAIVVNAPRRVVRGLGDRATKVFDAPTRSLPGLILSSIRVRQWVKNLLVFLPLILAHRYTEPDLILRAALAFLAFSVGASAVYVLNDLLDVEADRHHPRKRKRPFASGELPLEAGLVLIPLLAATSLAIGSLLPRGFLLVLLVYFGLTTLYSLMVKEIALVDVLLLAGLYTMRIIAGGTADDIELTEWLLGFSMFIFLSLAAVKRYVELLRLRRANDASDPAATKVKGRGYFAGDLEVIVQMGVSAGYIAVLVLALYISSENVTRLYARPMLLWLVCPLLLYWITRIWLLAHRGVLQEDPLSFSVKDRVTWTVAVLGGALLLASRGF